MPDASNQMPTDGYIFPLTPKGYWRDPTIIQAVCAGLDTDFEARRQACDALQASRYIDQATGSDLDALAALLDIPRYSGEPDGAYVTRIKGTAQHGVAAASLSAMQALLEAAFGIGFAVQNGASPARFTVFALGPLVVPQAVMALVRQKKLAGTRPTGYQRLPVHPKAGDSLGTVGGSVVGTTVTGGAGFLVPLS